MNRRRDQPWRIGKLLIEQIKSRCKPRSNRNPGTALEYALLAGVILSMGVVCLQLIARCSLSSCISFW